jgi:DNA-binding GntR family transcriptional regulator
MMEKRIITNRPLVDIVHEHLMTDIIGRKFSPGDKLPLAEIANRYGVSETPVKQAFSRLLSEGILSAVPRKGVRVRTISFREMRELMEARHMVHLYSVDAVIEVLKTSGNELEKKIRENLKRHGKIVEDLKTRLDFTRFLKYFEIEREYHFLYLKCLGNETIEKIFNMLYNQAYIYMTLTNIMAERIKNAREEHEAIFSAYRSLDRAKVVRLFAEHKENSVQAMNKIFLGDNEKNYE